MRKGNDLCGILNGVKSNGRTELELDGFFFLRFSFTNNF